MNGEAHSLVGVPSKLNLGYVDFYVNDSLNWLVELLINGRDIGKHISRFHKKTGLYPFLPTTESLVVDFHLKLRKIQVRYKTYLMRIILEPDFRSATICYRDGVEKIAIRGNTIKTIADL